MNSKNVIAITAYNKPDLLFLYLEQLYKEETIADYKIRIYTEEGYDKEEDEVVNIFKYKNANVDISLIVRDKHLSCPLTGFHNILTSYVLASKEAKDFVIIGEEDMLPTKDYVKFNKKCYDDFLFKYDRIFCIAHKRRPEAEKIGDAEILIGDYQCTSPSCVSVNAIKKYMIPFLCNPLFFSNPIQFYSSIFPESRISPNDHTHHDGAIERIMEHYDLFALKPDQARSMHVGLSGIFSIGDPPKGTLQERIDQWRELIKDGDKLRSLSRSPQDIVVTNPEGPVWSNLYLDLDRDKAKASSWWYDVNNNFKKYINEKQNI